MDVNGTSTLLIWSGRSKEHAMLDDLWAASLESKPLEWHCLYNGTRDDPLEDVGVTEGVLPTEGNGGASPVGRDGGDEVERRKKRKKHKKKKRDAAPLPRKGHVAVALDDPDRPLLVSQPHSLRWKPR
jgi:hypothetical protein